MSPDEIINDWYRDSMGCTMKVVAFDTYERTVEVPFFEDEVDEFNWYNWG